MVYIYLGMVTIVYPVVIIVQKKFGQKYPLAFNHTVLFDDY